MTRSLCACLLMLAGCSGPSGGADTGNTSNDASMPFDTFTPSIDSGLDAHASVVDAGTDAASAVDSAIDASASRCGTAAPSLTTTGGTEGLVIARDGTIYYSVNGGVAQIDTAGVVHANWLRITGSTTIWGLALDATDTHLFIGDPSTGQLRVATNLTTTPTQVPLAAVDQPNGVTLGADGAVYVSDFGNGTVLRVDATSGAMTTVTASTIAGADGVAFTDDGHLLVTSYSAGTVLSLTLDAAHHETARTTVASAVPSADGVAIDTTGVLYVGGGTRVYRIGTGGTPDMTLQMGHAGTANLEWGAGVLGCHDLYVATGGGLTRITTTATQRAVPWH